MHLSHYARPSSEPVVLIQELPESEQKIWKFWDQEKQRRQRSASFGSYSRCEIFQIGIDWMASNEQLVESFKQVVLSQRAKNRGEPGRKLSVDVWLTYLAIWRARKAGLTITNTVFDHNVFFGYFSEIPSDANVITNQPAVVNPGTGGAGLESLSGYRLNSRSGVFPGKVIRDNGGRDLFGKPVPADRPPCVGASEYAP